MKLLGCLVALAVGFTLGACRRDVRDLPQGLLGVWTTEAPKYQDRFFALNEDSLTFGTGEGNSNSNPIIGIELTEEEGRPYYHIEHLGTEGQSYVFSFHYEAADGGVITLKNQTEVRWTKERGE